jgi:hypothetical protein
MHLRYDEDFVEAAVFLCTSGQRKGISRLQVSRFHREREKLYSILEPDDRNAAFFRLHLEWFREWGMEALLRDPLKEFPLLFERLKILAFRKSRGKNDEGAELYVNEAGDRSGVVAIRSDRLEGDTGLTAFLRHELTHLHDMVDPGFGYVAELPVPAGSMNQQLLARERYRVLWDVSIDGRLAQTGKQSVATGEQRQAEFARAFGFWPEARQREVFDCLWSNPKPSHRVLVEWICDPRQLQPNSGPRPGAACPLCGFPTFSWANEARFTDETVAAIRAEFPHWTLEQGACARCLEIYRLKPAPSFH